MSAEVKTAATAWSTLAGIDRRTALAGMAGGATAVALPGNVHSALTTSGQLNIGRDQPFNDGWLFAHGSGGDYSRPAVDDRNWRAVNLPHDWSVEDLPPGSADGQIGPFSPAAAGGTATGFTKGGEGWYRKHFNLANLPQSASVELVLDGVYFDCTVWLNGRQMAEVIHGYIPFAVDLSPAIVRDGPNVLAIRVRNQGLNSRWYAGSGLYRHARLDVVRGPASLARWGVHAWTRRIEGGRAEIDVTSAVEHAAPGVSLVTRMRDASGRTVAEATSEARSSVHQTLAVADANLWSPSSPALYSLETELSRDGTVIDRITQPFGVRIVRFDTQQGLTVNGERLRIRGGCIHHDNGLLGACAEPDADERRVRLLKARGYNAIRSSHNPASASLRSACDRLGMLLIDEAFDMWHVAKNPQDFSIHFREHWHTVIEAMVRSARNSPSVIMWSIGNEICDRNTPAGVEWSWKLANAVHALDPTRPVTAALNGVLGAPVIVSADSARPGRAGKIDNASSAFIDVPGYNYRLPELEGDEHDQHPDRVIYASETFPKELFRYAELSDRAPWFLGEFVWTAMDYLGEAGIGKVEQVPEDHRSMGFGAWPWVVSWCGDLDLIGAQKAQSLARDVAWGVSPVEVVVERPLAPDRKWATTGWSWPDELQSWTWPGMDGRPLNVRVFARADSVELLLNGVTVGTAELQSGQYIASFSIPYAPGTLTARAIRNGKPLAERKLETVGAAAALRLTRETAAAPGARTLHYVAVEVVDAEGRVLPDDRRPLSLQLSGPVTLAAFGSGYPFAAGSFQAPQTETNRGRALAILRSNATKGRVRLVVDSPNLSQAKLDIDLD